MPDVGCSMAMELLNAVFTTPLILNDGHEILARLEAGDDVADVVDGLTRKFGDPEASSSIREVMERWPPLHLEAVSQMVQWALGKLDSDDRVTIRWKGDAEHHETVTRIELRDHLMVVEFAHPPMGA